MSSLSLQFYSLTKALLFSTNCRPSKLHLTGVAVLQSRQCLPGWDQPGNPFPLSLIRTNRGTVTMKGRTLGAAPDAVTLSPAWKKGLFGFGGWGEASPGFSSPAAIHSQALCQHKVHWHMFHLFLVRIPMYTAFSFTELKAILIFCLYTSAQTKDVVSGYRYPVYAPECLEHSGHSCLMRQNKIWQWNFIWMG